MAKPFKPVGPGGKMFVPLDPSKQDKIMDWNFQSGEPFTTPRKPGETLHAKGGRVEKHGSSTCCLSKYPHTSKAR